MTNPTQPTSAPPVRQFAKILIANRGEISSRITRTARRLGIATVAVFADADADLPYVRDADESVHLPGASAAATYLNIEALLAAAARTGAGAIHPGYGFLSERAEFARACQAADLVFIGPSAEVIEAMGSKINAKALVSAAGVPILPGAVVERPEDVRATGERIGWPLLIKAAFGGGGRGMRIVSSPDEVEPAVEGAIREAGASFGDATIFVERYVEAPRHIEVQVFGDHHGTVTHLFERECSIQRRYQKIIEESPSPAVDPKLRSELTEAAVAAARALSYVGAGTVEFVVDPAGQPFFLEVNTRLQVEHPVTEAVTGLDLVELQLRVAAGEPLPPAALDASLSGHAIEARLYAEDPGRDFLPQAGPLSDFSFPSEPDLRIDAGVRAGSTIGTLYDPMIAKVIAWGPTRAVATRRLADGLRRARIHGVITNRDLLVRVLGHPEFMAGTTDTAFLPRNDLAALSRPLADGSARRLHAVAAAVADRVARRQVAPVQTTVPAGWRNLGQPWTHVTLSDVGTGGDDSHLDVAYRRGGDAASPVDSLEFMVDGDALTELTVLRESSHEVTLGLHGVDHVVEVAREAGRIWVDSELGSSSFLLAERFPARRSETATGSLLAPMPGAVVDVQGAVGQTVVAGQVLLVLEAMKMEHPIRAPHAGTLSSLLVAVGDQVRGGAILAVIEETPVAGSDGT